MQLRFLLGAAGSGKTFAGLKEAREALMASPEGAPLVLVAPRQGTYQLEQQLLADPSLPGYTRLRILSFEGLARSVFEWLDMAPPQMLDEEGRLMVLRGLLAKKREDLKLFRASARLTGFAQQLSLVLRELQRSQLTPERLAQLADEVTDVEALSCKLHDLATLLQEYLGWLARHGLQDADCLLATATQALKDAQKSDGRGADSGGHRPIPPIACLWVDGFAEYSEQELDLLAALLPECERATLAFCLDQPSKQMKSWLSHWLVTRKTFENCQKRFGGLPNVETVVQILPRAPGRSRFPNNPVLQHLEQHWAEPKPYGQPASDSHPSAHVSRGEPRSSSLERSLRLAACADPEAEVTLAAREILRYVRAGGRYREVSVLLRKLEGYHLHLQRVLSRYDIPFFLDRRESVAHHPLAELTRSALRTVALGWQHEDWFAALKSGLVPAEDREIDRLENEALARGWRGAAWHQPIRIGSSARSADDAESLQRLQAELEQLRRQVVPPFERLMLALGTTHNKPTGPQLAAALSEFWAALQVEQRLQAWAAAEVAGAEVHLSGSVHATVWDQMNAWLENVELAFSTESLPLREWLPILEAGLGNLTVGIIPPALDQVLIGAIDRSRTPDINLALVLGLNETVFPAPPEATLLLTDNDRLELEQRQVALGSTARQQLGRERYLAYIACTRPRQRLVLTYALQDGRGAPLNPSPFVSQVRQLFPSLPVETVSPSPDWRESEHVRELVGPLLKIQNAECRMQNANESVAEAQSGTRGAGDSGITEGAAGYATLGAPAPTPAWPGCTRAGVSAGESSIRPSALAIQAALQALPGLAETLEQLRQFRNPELEESLAPDIAQRLYGPVLRTSVSRMEQFAACPFKFFVHSGLRAEERHLFELDVKEQGSFQHDVLALFHEQLRDEHKRWRDITPTEARERVARITKGLLVSYREGLLQSTEETRFMARVLTESLQDFVETIVEWMRGQYRFDPVQVELPFGEDEASPAWTLELGSGQQLALYGRIDRIDLYRDAQADEALCVVVDYKSSQKKLDPVLLAHGLQLQLLTYLNVVRRWPEPRAIFGVGRLIPAGVFYVNLRGKYGREDNRRDALANRGQARKLAYRHTGRFDTRALRQLDARTDANQGDQFSYRLTKDGQIYKGSHEALPTAEFLALLDSIETNLKEMGRQIFSGVAKVAPYRKGITTACDQCVYQSICRIDPWTHKYRVLRKD